MVVMLTSVWPRFRCSTWFVVNAGWLLTRCPAAAHVLHSHSRSAASRPSGERFHFLRTYLERFQLHSIQRKIASRVLMARTIGLGALRQRQLPVTALAARSGESLSPVSLLRDSFHATAPHAIRPISQNEGLLVDTTVAASAA